MLDKKIIGEAIVRLRGHRSQRLVAKQAGIPTGTWCCWEKGKRRPRDSQIPRLLKGLDCTEEDLAVTAWQIQGEKLKLKGSAAEPTTFDALAKHQERITDLLRENIRNAHPEVRSALIRLRGSIRESGEKLMAVQADLEALILALGRSG